MIRTKLILIGMAMTSSCAQAPAESIELDAIQQSISSDIQSNWRIKPQGPNTKGYVVIQSAPRSIGEFSSACFFVELEIRYENGTLLSFSEQLLRSYVEYFYSTNSERLPCAELPVVDFFSARGTTVSAFDNRTLLIVSTIEQRTWDHEFEVTRESYEEEIVGRCVRDEELAPLRMRSTSDWIADGESHYIEAIVDCEADGELIRLSLTVRLDSLKDKVEIFGDFAHSFLAD